MDSFQHSLVKYSLSSSCLPQERNVINFLICSAFEDYEIERKILHNRIFPKLRQQCFDEFGMEIRLIDVNLGLDSTQEISKNYHQIFNEYQDKHGRCDEQNCPIFLFGQKYGGVMVPIRLPLHIYELFQSTMRRYKKRFSVDHTFLNLYYKLDGSSIDPEMVLVTPHEQFPELLSENKNSIAEIRADWKNIKLLLSDTFQKLSNICLSNGTLDLAVAQNIFVYELETSISNTLSNSLNSDFLPIIVTREIIDIKNFIVFSNVKNDEKRKKMLGKLIDAYKNNEDCLIVNEDSQMFLRQCYNSVYEVCGTIGPTFRILWRDDTGICEEHHKQYIDGFETYFTEQVIEAVRQRSNIIYSEISSNILKCYDIICDANLQINKNGKLTCAYEDICSAILDYVIDDSVNIPMIICGPSNSVTSIIVSRTVIELQDQEISECHIIPRFINSSYTINEVLLSIFLQMSAIVLKENQFKTLTKNLKEVESSIPKDIEGVMFSFQQHSQNKFIVVLHDLDKCSDANLTTNFVDLIPKSLPDNMKLVVTTTENWEVRKPYFLNILVPELTQEQFSTFIQTESGRSGRYLTDEQNEVLRSCYPKLANNMLTVTILVNSIIENKWSIVQDSQNPDTNIHEFYPSIFRKWLKKFGEKLISHSLLFIYCSQGGLTDQEIVEVLNLDEEVMGELHCFYSESIIYDQDSLKFPLALWLFIKQELSMVLFDKMKDGYILVDLEPTSIVELLINSRNEDGLKYFHRILAEFYIGTWCRNKKPFTFNSSFIEKLYYCYPRDQKLFSKNGNITFYNYRKFRQLARHLRVVGMHEELLKEVIFNFDWLYNKIKALKVSELLEDFQLCRDDGKEILLLEESIRNSALIIENDMDSLAGELISQLLPFVPYYPNLRFLIENCDDIAPKHNAFIPIYATNKLPGSPLASTINCPGAIESVLAVNNSTNENNELLIKLKNDSKAYFYDLSFGEIAYHTLLSSGEVYIGPNKNVILVLETELRQIIKVHQRASGELIGQIIPMNWVILRPFEERNKYRITNIDVAETKVALIITNEVSYLFVLNLDTLEPILAFNPGVRLQMLKLTADESTVFTHHVERLVSLDVIKNQLNSAVELQGIPFQMIFSKELLQKAFIVCDNQKSVVVLDLESSSVVSKCYKISFENCLDENDHVLEVSCSVIGNPYLLIRSCHSVILYDWLKEKVLSHITRPSELPIYFKLPNQKHNQPTSLQFNAAKLILSDKVIVCSLFRDIIVCTVNDNKVLKTLHAPVGGIVSEILIVDQYIIGKVDQNQDSSDVMIWKTDPSCLFSKIETNQDKLTKSVKNLHVGESVAIATCENSDEMGVIEISTGTLVDLYSHSSSVMNSCLSSCGKWAFVTINTSHNANILWSLEARKISYEFGSFTTTAFIVQMKSASGFLCISNHSASITMPNFVVTQILCDADKENSHTMTILEIENLKFICDNPCSVASDTVFIFLSKEYLYEDEVITSRKLLTIWTRKNNSSGKGISETITESQLGGQIDRTIEDILTIKTVLSHEDVILLLYKSKDHEIDILLFNFKSKEVIQFLELFEILPQELDIKDIFLSNSGGYLFYQKTGSVVDVTTGENMGNIPNELNSEYQFRCFALSDTILVLSYKAKLMAWRLPGICKIGQIELKEEITCVSKCVDDFTLMIGCIDGSVLSYSLVDVFSPHGFLSTIKIVRNFQYQTCSPTIQLEQTQLVKSPLLSQEFDNLMNIKRPISEPIVANERREFSNIFG